MNRFHLATIACIAVAALLSNGCCEPLPPPRPTTPEPVAEEPAAEPEEEAPPVPEPVFVLLPDGDSNSVSFRFAFESGSADDPEGRAGITSLTANLMARGGTEDLTFSQLAEALFPMAADISVSVDRDQTVFHGRVHRDEAEKYYALIRDVLTRPRMAQGDFDRLLDEADTGLTKSLRGNDDEALGKAALDWLMYEGHPYRAPEIGTESGLGAITLEDSVAHRGAVFCGSRLTVGLAGAYDDALVERIREDMGDLPNTCELQPEVPAPAAPTGRHVLIVDKPTAEATAVSMGFPIEITRSHPDYPALKLVEAYFGQHRTFAGKLQKELRVTRGFNYGNYAYVEHFEQLGWSRVPKTNVSRDRQCFTIWLRPVKNEQAHFAVRLALDELEKLVSDGITEDDLARTRRFMKRYYLTFAQTEEQRLGYAIDDAFYGLEEPYFDSLFAAVDALTAEDVNGAIERNLSGEEIYIALVSGEAEDLSAALADDRPSPVEYDSSKPAEITERDKEIEKLPLRISDDAIQTIPVDAIFR